MQAKQIAELKADSVITKKTNKLRKLDSTAQQNLVEEESRLEKRVDYEKRVIGELEKVKKAAKEEYGGIKKTATLAKEMQHAAIAMRGTLKEQLRNRMRPA